MGRHLVAHAHDASVDGARDAIDHLHVELWEGEGRVDAGIAEIALRGRIRHVAHLEALHRLVLGHAPGPIDARRARRGSRRRGEGEGGERGCVD